jgi:predicted nucleic acid-binding protein
VKVIVDANIVFSAILNTDGKIGDLLLNSEGLIVYISPKYMSREVIKYYPKIKQLSGKTLDEIEKIHFKIRKVLTYISEEQIPLEIWINAEKVVRDIDEKDTPYFAFSEFLGIKIWTGDKKLRKGLLSKGFDCTITTTELYNYRNRLISK